MARKNKHSMAKKLREAAVQDVQNAIREQRAFLNTSHLGKLLVTGYNDETGWASCEGGKSFMVSLGDFVVEIPVIQPGTPEMSQLLNRAAKYGRNKS